MEHDTEVVDDKVVYGDHRTYLNRERHPSEKKKKTGHELVHLPRRLI